MFSLEIVETNEIKPRREFCFSFGFVFLTSFNVCFLLIFFVYLHHMDVFRCFSVEIG